MRVTLVLLFAAAMQATNLGTRTLVRTWTIADWATAA